MDKLGRYGNYVIEIIDKHGLVALPAVMLKFRLSVMKEMTIIRY